MSTEPVVKKLCTMPVVKIGTHNGTFHCDEVLACFMLKKLPKYKEAQIIRTRDPDLLATCDIVVDVGGVFDPKNNKFDHHQRTFKETMKSLRPDKKWTTKLSSAGLVYQHFGEQVVALILGKKPSDQITQVLYDKMYEFFIEEVDAIDNGINQTEEKPRYAVTTTLSSRVGHLNPRWNEPSTEEDAMNRFHKAMEMAGAELVNKIIYYRDAWWPARQLVVDALDDRLNVDSSGEIVAFSQGGCPWKDHLMGLEEDQGIAGHVKFVLYMDQNGAWRIQCVPVGLGSFDNRLSILKQWQGLRDDELSNFCGIPGCIFVHANGFIGGNKTYKGVLEMARRTLQNKPTLD